MKKEPKKDKTIETIIVIIMAVVFIYLAGQFGATAGR